MFVAMLLVRYAAQIFIVALLVNRYFFGGFQTFLKSGAYILRAGAPSFHSRLEADIRI